MSTLRQVRTGCFILAAFLHIGSSAAFSQSSSVPSPPPASSATQSAASSNTASQSSSATTAAPPVSQRDQRRAAKLFFQAAKLFDQAQFEESLPLYKQAADLDPANQTYSLALQIARSHAVTALVQQAARQRNHGDSEAARRTFAHATELDPSNPLLAEHVHDLANDALAGSEPATLYSRTLDALGGTSVLAPAKIRQSFHLHLDRRAVIRMVFHAYGIETSFDQNLPSSGVRFDIDDADWEQATRALALATDSFYVPLDAHHVVVALDTHENRLQYTAQEMETVYLPGLAQTEITDLGNIAKNVFSASQSTIEQSTGTLTIRAPRSTLDAFNATVADLIDGHSQVMLDVRLIQLAHTSDRNTGAQLPQQVGVFNLYSEAQSILSANSALVQEIVSSGLVSPTDYLGIIAILLASGQVSNPLFASGFATFGGGNISTFGMAPGTTTLNFALNTSDSRELDQLQLRLADDETGTLRMGTRYPIQTSSFSSLSGSLPNIPGLSGAGSSSSLSSLLASVSSVPPVPQVEYQDLGLTLKATPKVLRNGDVALTLDLKILALAGSSINGNPILDSRAYSGVVTVREGEAVEIVSEIDIQESRAISGTPGASEIPGLNNLTGKEVNRNRSTLVIAVSPHVLRGSQAAGHTRIMRIEKSQPTTR